MFLKPKAKADTEKEPTFISHLVEMRNRILRAAAVIVVIFLVVFLFFWEDILKFLVAMMIESLPSGVMRAKFEALMSEGKLVQSIKAAGPFLISVRISLVAAMSVALPYILYELWRFVAPGLYRHERKMIMPLVVSSTALFYAGVAFARYVVLPVFFAFMLSYGAKTIEYKPDAQELLEFLLQIFFAFGVAFEVPVATIILVWTGVTTRESLAAKRPYIIVGVFTLSMFLTPPDPFSQIALAIPMWLLFELGLIFSKFYQPKPDPDEPDDINPDAEGGGGVPSAPAPLPSLGGPEPLDSATNSDEDYRPKTVEEMDAELDRFVREMDELEREQAIGKTPADGTSATSDDKPPPENKPDKDAKDP